MQNDSSNAQPNGLVNDHPQNDLTVGQTMSKIQAVYDLTPDMEESHPRYHTFFTNVVAYYRTKEVDEIIHRDDSYLIPIAIQGTLNGWPDLWTEEDAMPTTNVVVQNQAPPSDHSRQIQQAHPPPPPYSPPATFVPSVVVALHRPKPKITIRPQEQKQMTFDALEVIPKFQLPARAMRAVMAGKSNGPTKKQIGQYVNVTRGFFMRLTPEMVGAENKANYKDCKAAAVAEATMLAGHENDEGVLIPQDE